MSYSPDELEKYLKKSDDPEINNKVFIDLFNRAKKLDLSYSESKCFCTILKHTFEDFGKPEDFEVCKEHIFNDLFRIYYKDLHGISELKDKWGNILSPEQKKKDLNKLDQFFQEWESVVKNPPQEELIIQIAKETRNDIKSLKRNPLFIISGIFYKTNRFKHQYKALLLRSRFIKNIVLEHIDRHGEIINVTFDKKSIEFNEFSLTHIFFRHSAKILKQTDLEKSFHIKEIDFYNLGIEMKDILEKIDKSGKFRSNRQIRFRFKSKYYSTWISPEREKSIKGVSGMQKYYRIETFYPIEKVKEIQQLKGLNTYKITNEIDLLQ